MNHRNHYFVMFIIMIISSLLSTMNVWVDKIDDIRFSLNDIYMALLMSGWMLFFMGLYYQENNATTSGFLLAVFSIWCIRNQFMVTENQYKLGMIPHHSMAIHMSKQLLNKKNNIQPFLNGIINGQEKEIKYMKNQIS